MDGARLRFGEEAKEPGTWAGRRLMWLDDQPAFELSYWCGTCAFVFKRLEGATSKVSFADAQRRLGDGGDGLDESIIAMFGSVLPVGQYLPLLLRIVPRLISPPSVDDYFAEDLPRIWNNDDGSWTTREYPQTPYYRTCETVADDGGLFYEFVVPMVPPRWNDRSTVEDYQDRLSVSAAPTAVAVSILDVRHPELDEDAGPDPFWGLTHFLLDGHNKMEAAATTNRPLQLLSLMSINASLANPEHIARLPDILRRP